MSFVLLGTCLALAAWAGASLLGALVVPLALRALPPLVPVRSARRRERILVALRLLPASLGTLVVFGLLLPSWLLFEPRATRERPGAALLCLALAGAGLLLVGLARLSSQLLQTRRVLVQWRGQATPLAGLATTLPALRIEAPFPVVSVAGVLRPRLYVERRVLAACDADELGAILAHERAHLRSRDNLKRVLLHACPDPLALTSWGPRLLQQWTEAAEAAADEEAAGAMRGGGLALASALVRLARLAPRQRARVPGSAVIDGSPIARRVERLLAQAPTEPRPRHGALIALVATCVAAGLGWGFTWLAAVHQLTERVLGP